MVEYPAVRLSRTFGALADPTRRDILARLRTGSLRVTEIAAPFDMSLNAVWMSANREFREKRLDAVGHLLVANRTARSRRTKRGER
jgi:DNA-binding transcriptional ArsR family regulator